MTAHQTGEARTLVSHQRRNRAAFSTSVEVFRPLLEELVQHFVSGQPKVPANL